MSMPRPARPLPWLIATLALAGALSGPTCTGGTVLYPTDACVVAKLQATATYCREAVEAWDRGDPSQGDVLLDAARSELASAWSSAEAKSLAKGVSCADTTATADEMIATVDGGAASLAAAIAESSGGDEQACESRRNAIAADACHHLVRVEANHLAERYATDRDRDALQRRARHGDGVARGAMERRRRADLRRRTERRGSRHADRRSRAPGGRSGARVAARRERVDDDHARAQVPYDGKTLEPICSADTP